MSDAVGRQVACHHLAILRLCEGLALGSENPVQPPVRREGAGGKCLLLIPLIDTCHFAWPSSEGRLGDLSGPLQHAHAAAEQGSLTGPHLRCRMTPKLLDAWGSLPTPVSWGRGQESTSRLSEEDL